jgi:hypothetical protein
MAWTRLGEVILVAHAPRTASEADWADLLGEVDGADQCRAVVMLANDMRPSPKQRSDIQKWGAVRRLRVCVITDSEMTRGAVIAISWFKTEIKAFSAKNTGEAFEWAGLPAASHVDAKTHLERLKHAVRVQNTSPAVPR